MARPAPHPERLVAALAAPVHEMWEGIHPLLASLDVAVVAGDRHPVDVVLVPSASPAGLDAAVAQARRRGDMTAILVVAPRHEHDLEVAALAAGADGFLALERGADGLRDALCAAMTRLFLGHLARGRRRRAARGG
jgi:DNA-binding NarL/FixJ family response regulator